MQVFTAITIVAFTFILACHAVIPTSDGEIQDGVELTADAASRIVGHVHDAETLKNLRLVNTAFRRASEYNLRAQARFLSPLGLIKAYEMSTNRITLDNMVSLFEKILDRDLFPSEVTPATLMQFLYRTNNKLPLRAIRTTEVGSSLPIMKLLVLLSRSEEAARYGFWQWFTLNNLCSSKMLDLPFFLETIDATHPFQQYVNQKCLEHAMTHTPSTSNENYFDEMFEEHKNDERFKKLHAALESMRRELD